MLGSSLACFALASFPFQGLGSGERIDPGVVRIVLDEADSILAGRGRVERVRHVAVQSGVLHFWVVAQSGLDTFLRIEGPDGALLAEDDDSGGKPAPYARVAVEAGQALFIAVAAAKPGGVGEAELHFAPAHDSDTTRAAAARATQELDDARRLFESGAVDAARERVEATIDRLAAVDGARASELLGECAWQAAETARELSMLRPAEKAGRIALAHRARTRAPDHPELQEARFGHAIILRALGAHSRARELFEQVIDVHSRMLPLEHPDLVQAWSNLGATLYDLGDITGAKALFERTLEVRLRTKGPDSTDLQLARMNLASALFSSGDVKGAQMLLEQADESLSRTLPAGHPHLQMVRGNLAAMIRVAGDVRGAKRLEERVVAEMERAFPAHHPDLQTARQNLAGTLRVLGETRAAHALFEQVLDARIRTLSASDPSLAVARGNLGATLFLLGDLQGARALLEEALVVLEHVSSPEDESLLMVRSNYGATLFSLGDVVGARSIFEQLLHTRSKTLPEDHIELQASRANLGAALEFLGELEAARAQFEAVFDVCTGTLPDDHPDLQRARGSLANARYLAGDLAGARELFEQALQALSRTFSDDHPDLLRVRADLSFVQEGLGDFDAALAAIEDVYAVRTRTLPAEHPDLQSARARRAELLATARSRSGVSIEDQARIRIRFVESASEYLRHGRAAWHAALLSASGREAEERIAGSCALDRGLSMAAGYGVFDLDPRLDEEAFLLSETTRGASLLSARVASASRSNVEWGGLRGQATDATDRLARIARGGGSTTELEQARADLELAQRALVEIGSRADGRVQTALEADVARLAHGLGPRQAFVAFRRYAREVRDGTSTRASTPSLCAWVLRADARLLRFELGPLELVEAAVEAWRVAVGVGLERGTSVAPSAGTEVEIRGTRVRELVLDPMRAALTNSDHWIVAPDAVLHLVPMAALPAGEFAAHTAPAKESNASASQVPNRVLLGERVRIDTSKSLVLHGLTRLDPNPDGGSLVLAIGNPDFDRTPERTDLPSAPPVGEEPAVAGVATQNVPAHAPGAAGPATSVSAAREGAAAARPGKSAGSGPTPVAERSARTAQSAGILRGTAWEHGFGVLASTVDELRGIGACATKALGVLPDTHAEVQGVGAYASEDFAGQLTVVVLERRKASRESLGELAPRARYLHIATHGWFAPDSLRSWADPPMLDRHTGSGVGMGTEGRVKGMNPMLLCGLALAGANLPKDGFGRIPGLVTAEELGALDLSNCELAVLSACDTNVGLQRAGQGVASLQKALHLAGARSVITSLWRVPDEATKDLMIDFYRRLWIENMPKHRALWEAQMQIRDERDERGDPKYTLRDWAAWVLTGDPE